MKRLTFCFLLILCVQFGYAYTEPSIEVIAARYEARTFKDKQGNSLQYRLFKPKLYDSNKKYPMVIFLHGSGEAGNDNKIQLVNTGPGVFSDSIMVQNKYPSFVICPQCPIGTDWGNYDDEPWTADAVVGIIDSLQNEFNIEKNQIYLTGLSMGGMGTWYLISKYPDLFAAGVPVAAAGDISKASIYKDVPVWALHGIADPVVPYSGPRLNYNVYGDLTMVDAVNAAGGNAMITSYRGVGHDSWKKAYIEQSMIKWLFSQDKRKTFIPDTGIKLSDSNLDIAVRDTFRLKATVSPDGCTDQYFTNWTSSNYTLVDVTSGGLVTGMKAGTATIYASTQSGKKDSCKVTTTFVSVTGVSLSADSAKLDVGSTLQLISTIFPANASNINYAYSTLNKRVATVNSAGLVKAISPGKTTIIIKTLDGMKYDSCVVVVDWKVNVNSFKAVDQMNIYPNPVSNGNIKLKLTDGENQEYLNIAILNIQGNVLYNNRLKNNADGINIDASFLHAGVYILKVKTNNQVHFKTFLVE